MSEAAKAARAAMRDKAKRLSGKAPGAVDASGWTEPTDMMPNVKTGARPISKRAFKRGGKVEGHEAVHHAGRKPRKAGGRALSADSLINRNVKEANEERSGPKHVGAFKKGGKVRREHHANNGPVGKVIAPKDPNNPLPLTPGQRIEGPGEKRPTFGPTNIDTTGLSDADRAAMDALAARSTARKRGGKVHPDVAEDKALIRKMVKPEARTGKKAGGGNWIAGAIKHPGALHKALHVKEGEKIPAKKLAKAEHSHNPKLAKRARLAETLKGLHKARGGEAEEISGTRPTGGRTAKFGGGSLGMNPVAAGMASQATPMAPMARKSGGRAGKGKMNVNIVIAGHHPSSAMGNPPAGQPQPPMPPQGQPVPVPMPMGPQSGGMPPGGAPMMPPGGAMPPMARARGGHVYPKMEYGSGGGEGRLEKIEEYGKKMRR